MSRLSAGGKALTSGHRCLGTGMAGKDANCHGRDPLTDEVTMLTILLIIIVLLLLFGGGFGYSRRGRRL
jgi:hypothetical protein